MEYNFHIGVEILSRTNNCFSVVSEKSHFGDFLYTGFVVKQLSTATIDTQYNIKDKDQSVFDMD